MTKAFQEAFAKIEMVNAFSPQPAHFPARGECEFHPNIITSRTMSDVLADISQEKKTGSNPGCYQPNITPDMIKSNWIKPDLVNLEIPKCTTRIPLKSLICSSDTSDKNMQSRIIMQISVCRP
eukprot:GHVL01010872.1.p1 GENE.GHVL01010872.1~~GHVL01010872.1.p1  ORF type:complete len:123 (+),score=12.01 GHVL01010872.1:454-822(+)